MFSIFALVAGIGMPVIAVVDGTGSTGAISVRNMPFHGAPRPGGPVNSMDPLSRSDTLLVPAMDIQNSGISASALTFQWAMPASVGVAPELCCRGQLRKHLCHGYGN